MNEEYLKLAHKLNDKDTKDPEQTRTYFTF